MNREEGIRVLFEEAISSAIEAGIETSQIPCNIAPVMQRGRCIMRQRTDVMTRLDALLATDSWCKWPGEKPIGEGEVWVYYPDKEPDEEDHWIVRQAQYSSWRAPEHDGNPFGWWDEWTDHWTPCIGVTHWIKIERPGPPRD